MQSLRDACAEVAARASHVRVDDHTIDAYADSLPLGSGAPGDAEVTPAATTSGREAVAAFWLTLDAINFGSGWFPTLRKRAGRSGYHTIASGLTEQFRRSGPWSAEQLRGIRADEIARVLGQDPEHELMALFGLSLRDLGEHVGDEHGGRFGAVTAGSGGSAVALAQRLGSWDCFSDTAHYDELAVPFLKRAQLAAVDLSRAGVASFSDLDRLTMFADNLVPHVLRLDRVLHFDDVLVDRINRGELIEHGSREEVEIRACAVHAVELIVRARPGARAADVDQMLWNRGQAPRYKASPRHRSRCTAY